MQDPTAHQSRDYSSTRTDMLSSSLADSASVASLDRLNEDVLRNLFQYLYGKDLWSLCLSNKVLAVIAEPFLYRRIDWDWTLEQKPPIISFLNAILRRPSLGTHVRILNLTGDTTHYEFSRSRLPLVSTQALDQSAATQALARTGLPFTQEWMKNITKGSMDALLALLLMHTPRLTHLLLGRTWSKFPRWLCRIIAAGLDGESNVPELGQLVEVSHEWQLGDREAMHGEYTTGLLVFWYLPHVRHIAVTLDNPIKLHWPTQPPTCTSLVSLRLEHVRESQLLTLLTSTPNLRKLSWEVDYHSFKRHKTHTKFFNLNELMTALKLFKDTLESLTLVVFFDSEDVYEREMETIGSVKGLSEFTALKDLRIPISFLDDFHQDQYSFPSIMPCTTEHLVLSEDLYLQLNWQVDDKEVIDALELMLRDWRADYPHLCSIEIIAMDTTDAWHVETREQVLELGKSNGLDIYVTVAPT